ncbi:hypothetical protein [Massilia genomosp. 1]|uniref:Uncharacterized protein n=1 Tax=Massilia genomosp. 1 TaxID=2609280 RepID=A0ABX0MMD8_9BURK|nr:hypothetical protein [Massilia genomosp. 1]NHZ63901.1 hypothetical protein [Massilia genomosp. 1]
MIMPRAGAPLRAAATVDAARWLRWRASAQRRHAVPKGDMRCAAAPARFAPRRPATCGAHQRALRGGARARMRQARRDARGTRCSLLLRDVFAQTHTRWLRVRTRFLS